MLRPHKNHPTSRPITTAAATAILIPAFIPVDNPPDDCAAEDEGDFVVVEVVLPEDRLDEVDGDALVGVEVVPAEKVLLDEVDNGAAEVEILI